MEKIKKYLDDIIDSGLEKNYWFMTKQTMTDFYFIFTTAKIVDEFSRRPNKEETFAKFYTNYFKNSSFLRKQYKEQAGSENTYRNAIISEFFGLIYRENKNYDSSKTTSAFKILNSYIKSYDDVSKFRFIIERQIEKLCLNINDKIQNYEYLNEVKIFPVMFLYKILFELYKKTGHSTLFYDEFVVFLVRAKKYSDWQDIINLIISYRNQKLSNDYQMKFNKICEDVTAQNIRFDALLGTLSNIEYTKINNRQLYKIKDSRESIRYIENALEIFESSQYSKDITKEQLATFIRSDKYFIGNLEVAFTGKPIDEKFTPKWFHEKGQEFSYLDEKAKEIYSKFQKDYGYETLKNLEGEKLLLHLFQGTGSKGNLCHTLEHEKDNELFGKISGFSNTTYPLFYSKTQEKWQCGNKTVEKEDAIKLAEEFRNQLLKCLETIEGMKPFDNINQYDVLENKLQKIMPKYYCYNFIKKYLHMMFPDIFSTYYKDAWQKKVLNILDITPNDTTYAKTGQINEFVKKCEISNIVFAQVLKKYCIEELTDTEIQSDLHAKNLIIYGVPGCGKSYHIEKYYTGKFDMETMERIVFHPDYTYSDFVGQILPQSKNTDISYPFIPGPFTRILAKAYNPENKDKMFYLIIEEINRGNAPAIFGDIFQLLDRDENGTSKYTINNREIAKVLRGDNTDNFQISLPNNLTILATMNTADQNVFTLDTAFKRRWTMKSIENKFPLDNNGQIKKDDNGKPLHAYADTQICNTDITWMEFVETINPKIIELNKGLGTEDKRIGTYFATEEEIKDKELFSHKVLMYLWNDAFQYNHPAIFTDECKTLETLISRFKEIEFKVFRNLFKDKNTEEIEQQ